MMTALRLGRPVRFQKLDRSEKVSEVRETCQVSET